MSKTIVYLILFLVVLIWGVSWPINKIGLEFMPPLWFALARVTIAALALFIVLGATGKLVLPRMVDIPHLLSVGLLVVAAFQMMTNIGLMHVNAGQSTILIYTTQFWVIPIAYIFFLEHVSRYYLLSLLLGLCGIIILFNPMNVNWHDPNAILGNGILLLAAMVWAVNIVLTRHMKWHTTPMKLLPWQLLIAIVPMYLFAYNLQPSPTIHVTTELVLSLLFTGILGTSFALWGMIVVSKELPVAVTSLLLLAVPVIGIISSKLMLNEPITLSMLIAMLFIMTGLVMIVMHNRWKRYAIKRQYKPVLENDIEL